MSSISLPPYDEYESAAPPSYNEVEVSNSQPGLLLPDTIEFYRATFPHYLITPPLNVKPVAGRGLAHVNVVLTSNSNGVGMTPESTVTVHSSAETASKPIGGMKKVTDLVMYGDSHAHPRNDPETSQSEFTFSGVSDSPDYSFEFARSGGLTKERFRWTRSHVNEVKVLATSNNGRENFSQTATGWKLTSATSDTVYAAYVPGKVNMNLNPRKLSAKLRFLTALDTGPVHDGIEEKWRLLVVLSVLSMLEKDRLPGSRSKSTDSKVAGLVL